MDSHCGASTQSVLTAHDHYVNTILTLGFRAYLACQHLLHIHVANPPCIHDISETAPKDSSLSTTMLVGVLMMTQKVPPNCLTSPPRRQSNGNPPRRGCFIVPVADVTWLGYKKDQWEERPPAISYVCSLDENKHWR